MKKYILQSLVIILAVHSAQATEFIDKLIKKDKVAESEYITHYNETQAITDAIRLIEKHKGTKLEPTLRHRLADLYVRQSQTRNFVDQLQKRKGKDASQAFEQLPAKRELLKKAIFELVTVEKQYPKYGGMDAVLHTMGMSHFKLGEIDLAERPFLKLTQVYPSSPLLQDARLLLGEVYYHQKEYRSAIKYFSYIAEDKNNKSQSYGFYKRGWSQFYLNNFVSAFNDLKSSYQVSLNAEKTHKFDLSKESLDDIPLFAAEIFKGHQIEGEFSKFIKNKQSLADVLDAQATVYSERSEYRNEIPVLQALLKRKRSDADQFALNYRLAKSNESIDNLSQMAVHYKIADKLIERKVDDTTKEEFLVFGRNVVKQRYKEWTKSKKKFDLRPVVQIGDLAHIHIKDQNDRAKFTNVLAELNSEIKDYAKASQYYELSSDLTKASAEAHELMYSSLFTLEQSIPKGKWNSNQIERQRHLVAKYRKRFPNGSYMIDVLYKFARVENAYGSKKIALDVFLELGEKYAMSAKGEEAQDFVVSIYEKQKNYLAINTYLEKVIPRTRNANRKTKLSTIYDNSFFLMAQNNESRRRYSHAIANYSDYLKKSVLKKQMSEAQWNIAINNKKANRKRAAGEAFLAFFKAYPKHERAVKALEESYLMFTKVRDLGKTEAVALLLEQNTSGLTRSEWMFERAKVQVKAKKEKNAENLFYDLVKVSDKKLSDGVHQFLFDNVDKNRMGFKNASLRVLQTGKEPFRSEAAIRVGLEYLSEGNVKAAKAKFETVLVSREALNESKGKASIFLAEMNVKGMGLKAPAPMMNFDQTVKYLEGLMLKATPVTERLQAVMTFNHAESSLRAYIKLSKVYLDLGMMLNQVNVNDKADLKLAIERELRNLKMTTKTSFYESYERALNIMARDSKLKRKYGSELRKVRKEFDDFYEAQKVAVHNVRGDQ